LKEVIEDFEMMNYFKLFLTREYSVENILFCEKVLWYKNEKDPSSRFEMATDIYEEFLTHDSLTEINTSNLLKDEIKNILLQVPDQISPDIFSNIIYELCSGPLADSYMRFNNTKDYEVMRLKYFEKYWIKSE
jgi:abortive infection bacteriophage resistance protein